MRCGDDEAWHIVRAATIHHTRGTFVYCWAPINWKDISLIEVERSHAWNIVKKREPNFR